VRCDPPRLGALLALFVAAWSCGCAHHEAARADAIIQQPLGTRAPAFAGYVIAMHRSIHKRFTLGFLTDIELRNDPAFADQALWTELSIAVDADGRVEPVAIGRTSGLQAFDVAAVDSVLAAAPFPSPPDAIKSADGKVHLDWQFHRDERGCGAFGVTPHIDGIVPKDDERALAETGAHVAHISEERMAAEGWFAAYVRRDPAWLAGWSATPFVAEGEVIARDGATLKKFYAEMVAAKPTGDNTLAEMKLLTPAEIRGATGRLPTGGDQDMLFATGRVGGETFTLLLKKSSKGWRVCGLNRARRPGI
jgi:TonB family protein